MPTPVYRLTAVQVQASYNNGRSWQNVTVQHSGSSLLALIANPVGHGFVSLRSIVTDSHGDKTVETIARAYMVDAAP